MKEIIAQLSDFEPLAQYGLLGIVLGWFMIEGRRIASEIKGDTKMLSHRIDGLTRALLMDMVNRDNVGDNTKQTAQEMIAKIEARNQELGS